jgi:hypothetical protein
MNPVINKLVNSILQKESLEQCTVEELKHIVDRYPFFSAARLLLLRKLKEEDKGQYNRELQKSSVYFYNQLWLDHILNETGDAELVPAAETPVYSFDTVSEPEKLEVETSRTIEETREPEPETEVEEAAVALNEINDHEHKDDNAEKAFEAELSSEPYQEKVQVESTPPEEQETGEMAPSQEKFLSQDIQVAQEQKTEMLFQPFYTVDYFASQGIKFREEAQPQDKFGKQLKSFTEWLKIMKRLPVSEIAPAPPTVEKKVEQLAEHSLQDREVLTEAMAEVWQKQGNAAKAVEIYSKLSLLDPSKSRYFAAKIEEIKKTN